MQTHPTISVLMSIYKESVAQIEPSVRSILSQTFTDFEYILVVDDPENHTAKKYVSDLAKQDARIIPVFNTKNLGLGGALNRASALARGRYCARMDTEDISFANRFETQVSYLLAHPETDLLFTQWQERFTDNTTQIRTPQAADVRNLKKNFFLKSLLLHPTMMVKTDILQRHPYPEMDRPEDWVLFLELIRSGYSFDLLETVLYEYKIDASEKYQKVRAYTTNLLPHLAKEVRYYWNNPYFWLYCLRVCGEYIISRNRTVYTYSHRFLTRLWRLVF